MVSYVVDVATRGTDASERQFQQDNWFNTGVEFIRRRPGNAMDVQETLSVDAFNKFYDFKTCYCDTGVPTLHANDPTCLVMTLPLNELLKCYRCFLVRDLVAISIVHSITLHDMRKDLILDYMIRHDCSSRCTRVFYVFRSRGKPRTNTEQRYGQVLRDMGVSQRVPRTRSSEASGVQTNVSPVSSGDAEASLAVSNDLGYLAPVDHELKEKIIRRWESATESLNISLVVCSVCGVREHKSKTVVVDGRDVNLNCLRNEDLPLHLLPATYDLEAYSYAILNSKGLEDTTRLGNMTMCMPCRGALGKGKMPKFALSNWLYYATDRLPPHVSGTLSELTTAEKMLIGRARCNSICCKFNISSSDANRSDVDPRLARLRKGIRGNIMVAPLDTIQMNAVLPPSPDVVRDTLCVVLVGDKIPTKDTIAKLGPLLVRKSRLKLCIEFLLQNNEHYSGPQGVSFSQANLDNLHLEEDGPEPLASVHIGQLPQRGAFTSLTSDYTPQNEDDFVDDHDYNSLLMENVGYTMGDRSPLAFDAMKIMALERCMSGKPFIVAGSGSNLVRDFDNPSILTWLFPYLDPWGIGGFHHPKRSIVISMQEQLSHLLRSEDRAFEQDAEFSFVFYNVIQKAQIASNVRFRIPKQMHTRFVQDLKSINPVDLMELSNMLSRNPADKPTRANHLKILKIVKSLSMVTRNLPGSDGYKLTMRNQIRSIINEKGCPTLFITINPSDVDNPIVRILAGEDIDLDDISQGEDLNSWRRKIFAARHPSACALFFDLMMKLFIDVVLGYGNDSPGLYGVCEAYYGSVEAQGKGTLHCHMLIWLKGHLSPQDLCERLLASAEFKNAFIKWLESIIMNEFPCVSGSFEDEPDRSKRVRSSALGEPHPGVVRGPRLVGRSGRTSDGFWTEYNDHLVKLLNEYHWHVHTTSCWKYLKRGQEKSDENCRLRMDGKTVPETSVDPATGRIVLRRLHPFISSHTDVVTFLFKSNVHVQFVGSGEEAKAYLYYLTDYITKPILPLHVGVEALSYGIQKAQPLLQVEDSGSGDIAVKALTKVLNSVMGRRELSHQQVMSYLVGGGDTYTSEKFQSVNYAAFLRFLRPRHQEITYEPTNEGADVAETGEEELSVIIDKDEVFVNNQVLDYSLRSKEQPYSDMSLYEFFSVTSKRKILEKERGQHTHNTFCSDHPQYETHRLCLKQARVIPVLLGPPFPNRTKSIEAHDAWARHMLIIFKPWRNLAELKELHETWIGAFQELETKLSPAMKLVVRNMQILTECADARFSLGRGIADSVDHTTEDRRDNERGSGNLQDEDASSDTETRMAEWKESHGSDVFRSFEDQCDEMDDNFQPPPISSALQAMLGGDVTRVLDACFPDAHHSASTGDQMNQNVRRYSMIAHGNDVQQQQAVMKEKRKRRVRADDDDEAELRPRQKRRLLGGPPFVAISTLPERDRGEIIHELAVRSVLKDMNLENNNEQKTAFLTVANHLGRNDSSQLLMNVAGVGGTGKSHVIKSLVLLFERLGIKDSLLLGAPTGIAAVLIGGNTLHSLILESPNKKGRDKNVALLMAIWKAVRYLVVDEVSMLGARFLSLLSDSIRRAKGNDPVSSRKPFGGVSVIFMGDLCQLKPPKQHHLYCSKLTTRLSFEEVRDDEGISAMNGLFLWRQVTHFVELVKNVRHSSDHQYSECLSRLRLGRCISGTGPENDDYEYLQTRLLTNIYKTNPAELENFKDAPIIVGSKSLRDLLNAKMITHHASRLGCPVHVYHSKDMSRRLPVPVNIQDYLWSLGSSYNKDSFGRLPMFEGMKVMITENMVFDSGVVNGTEGIVRRILYEEDEAGRRCATVAYVQVEGSGFDIPGLEKDWVPVFPSAVKIDCTDLASAALHSKSFTRWQLPLIPAYVYTDFKGQGRTLTRVLVDIVTARGQGAYVMLSRVKTLSGLAILRWFPPSKVFFNLPEELRIELRRLGCRT